MCAPPPIVEKTVPIKCGKGYIGKGLIVAFVNVCEIKALSFYKRCENIASILYPFCLNGLT